MRAFAQRSLATQLTPSAKSTGRADFGQGGEVDSILHLQRTITNQAVPQLLETHTENDTGDSATSNIPHCGHAFCRIPVHAPVPFKIQTKLTVNTPGDVYEQEADRIADQVMATPTHPAINGAPLRIQRFSGQSNGQIEAAPASVDQALASPGRPLEPTLRLDMEQRFGHDFSRVRVHSGAAAEQSARDVSAHAYTVGQNIVFGAGRFAPGTNEGQRLITHELTHVVQQSGSDGIRVDSSKEERGLPLLALEMVPRRTPGTSSLSLMLAPSVSPSGFGLAAIQEAAGSIAIQHAAREVGGEDAAVRSASALNFLSVAPVNVRNDPEAVTFLRRNQAVAATLDASTIVIDPAYRDSRTVLSHEYAHVAQLRSGLAASRDVSERTAGDYARGARTDVGGAAAPPLFQLAPNALTRTDPLAAEAEARGAAEVRDLPKLGWPTANVPSTVDVGGEGTKLNLGRRNVFHATVSAAGANGQVESSTDFTVHMDPQQRYGTIDVGPATGPPAGTIVTIEGPQKGVWGFAEPVKLYPVVLRYERSFHLTDRDGRTCHVTATSTVQFSYETWESATAGRTPSLETLQALAGDTAFTGVVVTGEGPVQKYDVMVWSEGRSIAAGIAEAQANLEASHALKDVTDLPMTFIWPNQTAGAQFETLEAILARLDEKELERRAKLHVMDLSGSDPDKDLPPWVRGVMSTLEKAILGIAAVFAVAAVIAALPFEIAFGTAVLWVGATLLAYSFATSLISRIKEAAREGIHNPLSVLSASILDTIGAGGLYEAITDRSLLSDRELNRTEEERWELGSSGVLGLIMTAFGVRAAKNYKPKMLDPLAEPEPVPTQRPQLEDHPGMDQWTEGHDPSPQVVTRLNQVRCSIGEQGVAFDGYPHSRGWAFIDGPSGAGGHAWNRPGFDGVAFRFDGPFEMEIIDNKAFASTADISSASAITRNLQTNLTDLSVQIADPVYDSVPRIADVRSSVANARTALQNGTPLPPEIRLVVTNFGGRSQGISPALQLLGIIFRNSN